jgi:hypothetical protein
MGFIAAFCVKAYLPIAWLPIGVIIFGAGFKLAYLCDKLIGQFPDVANWIARVCRRLPW